MGGEHSEGIAVAKKKAARKKKADRGEANLGFEAKLWLAADKLRNNMDAAEYSRSPQGRRTRRLLSGYKTRFCVEFADRLVYWPACDRTWNALSGVNRHYNGDCPG